MTSHAPHGRPPLHAVQVLAASDTATGGPVRTLAAGLTARGVRVTVCAPEEAERALGFTGTGARHRPLPARGSRPSALALLRGVCTGADVVHAHGLRPALRAAFALRGRPVPLVVTWPSTTRPAAAPWRRVLERRAARAASVVLGASPTVVDGARASGARDARLAATPLPTAPARPATDPDGERDRHKIRAELGAMGRPLLFCAAPLEARAGLLALLDAARAWRRRDPAPLLLIAGEGPLRPTLTRRIRDEHLPVRLLGLRSDVPRLVAAADVALLPAGREARPLLAQEALRAGVPLVAAAAPALAELVVDGAELVPPDDAAALAAAVSRLLYDADRRTALAARGLARAADWPTEDSWVGQLLSIYDELTGRSA
ncbi:glycosyltransferase family 4 protein [Streptomyces sp. NPDC058045]|uniref:glycosyltransferase family 4 protein n=1 Tax=Streptomyces sp. NPDC058045 TaxID=3346311 RepID=UPI0036E5AB5E